MTTPTVTEQRRPLEPVTADPFTDASVIRELDHRQSDGIDVRLLWDATDDRIIVAVSDAKSGDAFDIEVERHQALHAFHHPYAHASR